MSARDELAGIISGVVNGPAEGTALTRTFADAILAAGYTKPRTITTAEELDALIAESVVRSAAGIVYERYADEDGPEFDYWLIPGEQRAQPGTKIDLPAKVLYDPEATA